MLQPRVRNRERKQIHRRIRKRLRGRAERPRLNVFRSLKHIYAQIVDDSRGVTLVSASSLEKDLRSGGGGNVAAAREVGKRLAARALEKQIRQVAFDRGGYKYHGRVKALAEAAREGGLQF